jgi:hypothetical protein
MQHPDKHTYNIKLKQMKHWEQTLATYLWNTCNISIYFYNIHIKHLQHITETLERNICNIGEGRPGPIDSGRRGGSRQRVAAHKNHQHYWPHSWVPLARPGTTWGAPACAPSVHRPGAAVGALVAARHPIGVGVREVGKWLGTLLHSGALVPVQKDL